jgi:hypothetical protein
MNHGLYDASEGSAPLPEQFLFVTQQDATAKARRAFLYAAVIFGALGFAAGFAGRVMIMPWIGG